MRDYLKVVAVLFAILSLTLAGCAGKQPLSPALQREADTALFCEGEEQCKEMWERATFWVKSHSGFKLQILNDSVIETYNSTGGSVRLAFSVTREPLGGGRYQIWTNARCDNIFGCETPPIEAIARAKYYMRTGQRLAEQ